MKHVKIFLLVAAVILVCLLGYAAFGYLCGLLLRGLSSLFDVDLTDRIEPFWILVLAFVFFPKRWFSGLFKLERAYKCHGTTEIDAPIAEVWDQVRPRPRTDYYQPTMRRIEAVEGHPDRFDLVFKRELAESAGAPKAVKLRVEESRHHEYLRFCYLNADELPLFGKDISSTEIWLSQKSGKTTVTYAENLDRITLVSFLAFLFLNPAKDGLKRLKAKCEGTPDTSWMGREVQQSGPSGEPSPQMQSTIRSVMASAVIVTMLMTAGVVWLALSMAS